MYTSFSPSPIFALSGRVIHKVLSVALVATLLSSTQLYAENTTAATAASAAISQQQQEKQEAIQRETYQQLEIFSNVLSIIEDNYVEEVPPSKIIKGAIKGLLQSLDPHSRYLSPEEFADLQEDTSGQFAGIGIEVTVKDDKLTIITPLADTPAAKAHLKAGDIIVAIDGKQVKEIGAHKAIDTLRGEKGSAVVLSILRQGWETPREFNIIRKNVLLHSVKTEILQPGMVYIEITTFMQKTSLEIRKQLQLLAKKSPIQGIILDLRNNPGGLLEQAVEVSDIFLNQGVIVSTKGRQQEQDLLFSAHNNSKYTDCPLVVLINESSASAAEIVAGAIQAHKRGVLVGCKSFGKGSVQSILPLPDGAGIRITTAKYYTPDDRSIQAVGITPDICVKMVEQPKENMQPSGESSLPNHLPQETVNNKSSGKRKDTDNQLATAQSILANLIFHTKKMSKKN